MQTSTPITQAKPRLSGLDYLRGLAAFGIMIYHYSSWLFGEQESNSIIGRIGIYGVAIFYTLSGQTLSYIYNSNLGMSFLNLKIFYKKRFFRIFPLLWLATLFSISISKHTINKTDLLLNITGLFGLFKWDTYFATGAWSIGNELFFYITFPLLLFMLNKFRLSYIVALFIGLALSYTFAFNILNPTTSLSSQWHNYTNPLNQFIFFIGGVVMGKFINPNKASIWTNIYVGLLGLSLFAAIPISGNAIMLVTGTNRLLFIISCFLICYSFFVTSHEFILINKHLLILGQISYSLYLLHPLVFNITKGFASATSSIIHISSIVLLITSVLISLIVSYLSYHYFERFFIELNDNKSKNIK